MITKPSKSKLINDQLIITCCQYTSLKWHLTIKKSFLDSDVHLRLIFALKVKNDSMLNVNFHSGSR